MSFAAEIRDKATTLWHIQRVKGLVRDHAQIGPHALITVTEFHCTDPACPGLATRITVFGIDLMRREVILHRPVAQITAHELRNVTATRPRR